MAEGQGRSSGQGVKLLYIRDYLYKHATKEHPKNANDICDYLLTKEIESSPKTIYNDITRLRYDFGVPVEYNASKWGYYITKPEFEPHELRLMVDSIQASKFITQAEARTISQKIVKLADVYTKESLTRNAYVADRVRSMNESVVRDADRLHRAIAENRKIGFRYFHYTPSKENPKQYSKKGDLYIVSPYGLLWDNGNYYLYAYITEKNEFHTFRIDRMERITNPLPEKRDGEAEFKKERITNQAFKVFQQYHGEQANVRIRFINRLADAVIDQFGKEIMLIPTDEKHFTATLPVELSPPFYAWVATFGRGAKILTPQIAIDGMRTFIEKVSDMYKNEG
ncbi:MAG: WYL domain-containing protein [Oscillospiraceae bacterium]|nr:WYL domain-containing protein [Oscillospiraceae bacterium]